MKQSRATSLLKTTVSTAVGFIVALGANALVLPLFGFQPSLSANFELTCIYTVISLARGYLLERAFEAMGWRTRMSAFVLAALAELQRQRTQKGYTLEHDRIHTPRDIAWAGAAYFIGPTEQRMMMGQPPGRPVYMSGRRLWPWRDGFKPGSLRDDLVRGCALGLAAGELADATRKRPTAGAASEPELEERRAHV